MKAKVELLLTGSMDHLRLVWQTGETLVEPLAFREDPEGTRYNVLLALQEMVTNVLRHAYGGSEENPVRIVFEVDDGSFKAVLMDCGEAFNPLDHKLSPEELEGMPDEAGGYGILITTMVMDEVSYEREGNWNKLSMCKLVDSLAPAKAQG
ncbi:MAG: ATP-binding protein [Planctomycetota bacterium]|jgi:anti-sigma regulatory factor (Ser/Thr protein kinase)